jgi:hypothetical protein
MEFDSKLPRDFSEVLEYVKKKLQTSELEKMSDQKKEINITVELDKE